MFRKFYAFLCVGLLVSSLVTTNATAQMPHPQSEFQNENDGSFKPFGKTYLRPDFFLKGEGKNVDTIAFWEAPDPAETLMFVTSKGNQLLQVWKYPFDGNQQKPLRHSSFGHKTQVNGVVIDQQKNLMYVTVSKPVSAVSVFSLPDLAFVREIIRGEKNLRKEPGIDLLFRKNGETLALVTSDEIVYVYNAETGAFLNEFEPKMSIETVLTDEFYNVIYLPDENKKKGIFAYNPDWTPFEKNGKSVFGDKKIFQSDGEGILLYTIFDSEGKDSGAGLIVAADQKKKMTDFEFFDRKSWQHLGTLRLRGVSNTDGIASTQQAMPDYPMGLFVAINDDKSTAGIGWDKIFAATGLVDVTE